MNYREWLLYRAQHYEKETREPAVLRYSTWQNHRARTDWVRRSDAAHMLASTRAESESRLP